MKNSKEINFPILLENINFDIFLPENIKSGSNILIFGNTCNFFGNNIIIYNNDNEFERLKRFINAINNKCNFYIICSNEKTYEYYKKIFTQIRRYYFCIKAINTQIKVLEPLYYNKNNKKIYIKIIEKYIKNLNMKFDICLMNPPFGQSDKDTDKNLHVKFLSLAEKISNIIISIQPSTWINDSKKVNTILSSNRAIDITIYSQSESKQMFNKDAEISQELGILKITFGSGAHIKWNDTNNIIDYPEGLISYNPIDKFGNIVKNIFKKAEKLSKIAGVLNIHTLSKGNSNGGIPNVVANRKLQVVTDPKVLKDKWCVKLTNINQSDNTSIIMKNKSIPFKNDGTNLIGRVYCIFDNEYQANNFHSYCQTDFVRLYVKIYARASDICYSMNYIPWVPDDFNTVWDDNRIAQEIDLTEEEKKFIYDQFHKN